MPKGSQLSQLKSALSQAGITRQPQSGKNKRKRSGGAQERDRAGKAAKLDEIYQKLNPFDVKVTKLKHEVGGRRLKGVTGRPAQSKEAGIQQRKKTLLKEYEEKGRAGGIVDRRFGENDPSMSLEERMLERFTRERQRTAKSAAFNLEDEEELTHYGQSLSKLDDFDDMGLRPADEEEEEGQMNKEVVQKAHFGGFEDGDEGDDDDEPARKKSKAEVMAEVIIKSKEHKLQRRMDRENDDTLRHELDQEFDALRSLLMDPGPSSSRDHIATTSPAGFAGVDLLRSAETQNKDYDQNVRELAFEKRAKAKDRTKTEEEIALEEKTALEKAEQRRKRRMQGEDFDSDEEEEEQGGKRKRMPVADDLGDAFDDEEEAEWGGLGPGLTEVSQEADEGIDPEESGSEKDSEDSLSFDPADEIATGHGGDLHQDGKSTTHLGRRRSHGVVQELPYTFPCPTTHVEFLDVVKDVDDKDVPTVLQRIRALYHPSLGPDNKLKLHALTSALLDHILYITAPPVPRVSLLSSLIPHLVALTKAYPIPSAKCFVSKISLMHKNLQRGLARGGAVDAEAKTWPGVQELCFLRLIGTIWPTSDKKHAVVTPTRLLMGAYLGLCRVRDLKDMASGLFLCTLFLQFEVLSKRLVPEAVNFVANAVLHMAPHRFRLGGQGDKDARAGGDDVDGTAARLPLPGCFPCPDLGADRCKSLKLNLAKSQGLTIGKPDLVGALLQQRAQDGDDEQIKVDLLGLALELVGRFADMYKGLDGFIELYEPIQAVLEGVEAAKMPAAYQARLGSVADTLTRLLKFSHRARRPLRLQEHKPIPIPSYVPKFETKSSSTHLRHHRDPDRERNEAAKLRYQHKQERKGAMRELRKDARFLAGVQRQKSKEKDEAYGERMRKVFASLEGERAEQKAMEREKARNRRRSGKK